MPNPKVCNRIADPAARRRCLNYQGEFAGPKDASPSIQGPNPGPWNPSKPRPNPNPRSGSGGRRRRGGGGSY